MRRILLSLIVILLVSCNGESDSYRMIPINGETNENVEIYEQMRKELFDLPDEFPIDREYDRKFILVPLDAKMIVKSEIDFLYNEITLGKEISRIIVEYTDEGDPILTYVYFNGDNIFLVSDTTRDEYGKPAFYQKSYKTMKYETDGYRHKYFAVNDTEYTYDEIRKSWEENDFETGIDYYPIVMFMRHDMDKYK